MRRPITVAACALLAGLCFGFADLLFGRPLQAGGGLPRRTVEAVLAAILIFVLFTRDARRGRSDRSRR